MEFYRACRVLSAPGFFSAGSTTVPEGFCSRFYKGL